MKQISARLGITLEQLTQIQPSLREHLIDLSRLLQNFVVDPGKSFEEFEDDYEKMDALLYERLKGVLNPAQTDKLIILPREILD